MDEDIIDDMAFAFSEQLQALRDGAFSSVAGEWYYEATLSCIVLMASVINNHNETYDLRYFYKNCGYPEPYPQHDMH